MTSLSDYWRNQTASNQLTALSPESHNNMNADQNALNSYRNATTNIKLIFTAKTTMRLPNKKREINRLKNKISHKDAVPSNCRN